MLDTRSRLLDFFFKISLVILIVLVTAIIVWVAFFGGSQWLSYWIKQILK